MRTDTVIPRYSFAKKFTVTYPDRSEWKRQNIQSLSMGSLWYTGGSKTSSGTGGGVFGGKTGLVFSLVAFATVFHTEVFVIVASIRESIARGYNGRTITIFTDSSQAALKALESVTVKSNLVLECLECLLSKLATHKSVQLVWVPVLEGILGNERSDELVKQGADTPFTGSEPARGLPYSVVKRAIRDWMEWKHIECWNSVKDCKHSKALMEGPQEGRATKLLNMSRR